MRVLKRQSGGLPPRAAEDLRRRPSAPTESNLSPAGKSGRGRETQEMDAAGANKWRQSCAVIYLTQNSFLLIQR